MRLQATKKGELMQAKDRELAHSQQQLRQPSQQVSSVCAFVCVSNKDDYIQVIELLQAKERERAQLRQQVIMIVVLVWVCACV